MFGIEHIYFISCSRENDRKVNMSCMPRTLPSLTRRWKVVPRRWVEFPFTRSGEQSYVISLSSLLSLLLSPLFPFLSCFFSSKTWPIPFASCLPVGQAELSHCSGPFGVWDRRPAFSSAAWNSNKANTVPRLLRGSLCLLAVGWNLQGEMGQLLGLP